MLPVLIIIVNSGNVCIFSKYSLGINLIYSKQLVILYINKAKIVSVPSAINRYLRVGPYPTLVEHFMVKKSIVRLKG